MLDDESELETAFKVVAIMQTITEDLDERGKRAWRKMLGLSDNPMKPPEEIEESQNPDSSD